MKTYTIIDVIRFHGGPRWTLFLDDEATGGALIKISSYVTREDAETAKAERERQDRQGAKSTNTPKRSRDPNQLTNPIVNLATGAATEEETKLPTPTREIAPPGGLKSGRTQAASLTPERSAEIARKAATKRRDKTKES